MPELPEVETVRRGLDRHARGRRIERVEVGRERVVRRTSREALVDGLTNTRIERTDRRGKYLLLPLDSGDVAMIHLRMSGQVLIADGGAARPAHTHVVMHLDNDSELWFVDPRTFGEVVVFAPDRVDVELPELAKLGIDPIAEPFAKAQLSAIVRSTARALKPLLLDQHKIAGIGNIYADEILHAARLRPDRPANTLDARAITRLHLAIVDVLSAAIAAGGSTLGDAQYVDLMGEGGSYQDDHRVYARGGERCLTCGRGWIRRTVSGGRGTHYCPVCQY
ncbi:bifunctional DNA-formamidopyrimidine glycosylase/DNA-(apurinic or apyrimidinic site) lyase [Ilumatobacter coccineus]|uniref:Formamidopyrimidine-DNA glycosylase n=1 Tax=Ilumatobacter coccineus (strain NBRC 103263 / KCTC 29153 / YM16-304) TaxID=1313172 RepID=A0A6C7E821_ILUCY|nr:bifunctional DNA-formamidopyrimidine glycosylase/DNA-(apurinic or apyrimidinic site) lyase [Ilumatobacter coccineus]BAN02182.1 formamidopyrimidine-DNA glycosylase/DNA-(apurinic or apyrimidinic site) lyase [Ilumatobacter coccineus YM16-304]